MDAKELLESLESESTRPRWVPLAPADALGKWRQWPLRREESLEYLHAHWALPDQPDPAVAGRGIKSKLVKGFGRLTFRVLGPYLRQERDFMAHLVRINEALAQRCDELAHQVTARQVADAENDAKLAAWLEEEFRGHRRDSPGDDPAR